MAGSVARKSSRKSSSRKSRKSSSRKSRRSSSRKSRRSSSRKSRRSSRKSRKSSRKSRRSRRSKKKSSKKSLPKVDIYDDHPTSPADIDTTPCSSVCPKAKAKPVPVPSSCTPGATCTSGYQPPAPICPRTAQPPPPPVQPPRPAPEAQTPSDHDNCPKTCKGSPTCQHVEPPKSVPSWMDQPPPPPPSSSPCQAPPLGSPGSTPCPPGPARPPSGKAPCQPCPVDSPGVPPQASLPRPLRESKTAFGAMLDTTPPAIPPATLFNLDGPPSLRDRPVTRYKGPVSVPGTSGAPHPPSPYYGSIPPAFTAADFFRHLMTTKCPGQMTEALHRVSR